MTAQLIFAGLVVLVDAGLIFSGSITQDAGVPILAAALGYVFGAGAEKSAEEIRKLNGAEG